MNGKESAFIREIQPEVCEQQCEETGRTDDLPRPQSFGVMPHQKRDLVLAPT